MSAQLGVGQDYMDMGWQTALSGMVGVNVPFPNGQTRRDAFVASAEAELAARRVALEDRRRQVRVELEEALAHLHHLAEQLRLFQCGILPQARQALEVELVHLSYLQDGPGAQAATGAGDPGGEAAVQVSRAVGTSSWPPP